ncbi:hypothetical protein [Nocardioides bizhenqiangii]|uniref:Uncharacterized protein n=1 Tax=Nocardioides bizhenqiangii TaxID=3095076 RepID=A0ABZ0ZTS5_9ACTN|nr:hypothetical protein [Nocardioides sp. HM61]WQQ27648.1 hypothetical protein SHK19_05285 [Nocardioides sp. HM61]
MKTPPGSDVSERSSQARYPASTVPDPSRFGLASESRTTVDLRPLFCTCGCGTPGPLQRMFVPGHNQRLRGALTRAYRRAQLVRVVQALGEPQLAAAPAVAEMLGPEWLAWVAPNVEVLRAADGYRDPLEVAANEFENRAAR